MRWRDALLDASPGARRRRAGAHRAEGPSLPAARLLAFATPRRRLRARGRAARRCANCAWRRPRRRPPRRCRMPMPPCAAKRSACLAGCKRRRRRCRSSLPRRRAMPTPRCAAPPPARSAWLTAHDALRCCRRCARRLSDAVVDSARGSRHDARQAALASTAAPALARAMDDDYWQVRLRAARSLGRLRDAAGAAGADRGAGASGRQPAQGSGDRARRDRRSGRRAARCTRRVADPDPEVRKAVRLALQRLSDERT